MKKYETYKESGVDWMGEIPVNWTLLKIGRTFSNIGSGTTPKSTDRKYYDNGNINWLNTGDLNDDFIHSTKKKITSYATENNSTLKLHPKESVVIALYGATIGKLGYLKIESTTNQACCVLSNSDKVTQRFLFYYFSGAREFIISKSYGGGQPNISQELIKQLYIASPSKKEQTQIANYLDQKTAIIDALIEKKEQLLKKLKAQRQAIINEAVTKGLNKNAKMKASGIEWLGEIPEYWEVTSVKNILAIPITDGPHTTPLLLEKGIPFISAEAIKKGKLDFNKKRGFISQEDYDLFSKKYITRINDIYMVKSGATTGNIARVETEDKFTIWSPLAVFRANEEKVFYDYLFYYLQSSVFKYQVVLNWSYGTQQNIGMGVLSNLKISFPDIEKQKEIIKMITIKVNEIDYSSKKINQTIDKLKFYRQSIISEAVTGKIDVRDWQAKKA